MLYDDFMIVNVNGNPVQAEDGCTIEQLLEAHRDGSGPCAVEVNRTLVRKQDHPGFTLSDGDRVEIVTLVGGG